MEFAKKAWPGHEVLVTTHSDAEHIHSHFVINSVNFENGYKLRQNPQSLIKLRALSDEICKAYGLSILTRYEGGGSKVSSREYRAAVKGESWKFRLMSDIDAVMNGRDPEGKALLDRDIAAIAEQLLRLQEAGVPVLWLPLHESSGGWFWWGAKRRGALQAAVDLPVQRADLHLRLQQPHLDLERPLHRLVPRRRLCGRHR